MRLFVENWDPAYGAGVEAPDFGAGGESSAELDTDVELPAAAWRPLTAPGDVRAPEVVLLVDGVRRIDARVWLGDEEAVHPGLAASFAAGLVRCDLRRGAADLAAARVARGIFTPSVATVDVVTAAARYPVHRTAGGEPPDLIRGVQRQLQALEVAVSTAGRDESATEELLVVDGPLRGRAGASRMLGYVKSHEKAYLPAALSTLVGRLRPGERSPVFLVGTRWRQFSWYLRLPGPAGAPWGNMVRVECSAELPPTAAVAMADVSAVALPRFASTAYKDPRAPQNLVPIAGLERRLRAMLGDARLLHRALTLAAHGEPARSGAG